MQETVKTSLQSVFRNNTINAQHCTAEHSDVNREIIRTTQQHQQLVSRPTNTNINNSNSTSNNNNTKQRITSAVQISY